jgi:cytochrome P450
MLQQLNLPKLMSRPKLDVQTAHHLLNTKREQAWPEIVLKYGKTFHYQGVLMTCDPELVQTLLMEKVHTDQRSSAYKLMGKIPGAEGVLFMDGTAWQKRTQTLMPTFSKTHIDKFPEIIHQAALAYADRWQDGEQLDDLFAALMEMGAAIALKVGGGLDSDQHNTKQLATELIGYKTQTMSRCPMKRLDEFGFSPKKLLHLPWIFADMLKLDRRMHRLCKIIQSTLQAHPRAQEFDWFDRLQKAGFSLAEITNQINHLYGAFNAIDFVITSGFYELSRHPEWATKLRTELQSVLGDRAYPTRDDFPKLTNTINFMREVMRRYPVAMTVMRRTGAEIVTAQGEIIPKNTEVMILLYALHHHPDFWQQPDVFDPDRWLSATPHLPYTYIPFLEGPRQCIGRHWAELEFVVILNALLQRYEFKVLNHNLRMTQFLIPRFSENMPCMIKPLRDV